MFGPWEVVTSPHHLGNQGLTPESSQSGLCVGPDSRRGLRKGALFHVTLNQFPFVPFLKCFSSQLSTCPIPNIKAHPLISLLPDRILSLYRSFQIAFPPAMLRLCCKESCSGLDRERFTLPLTKKMLFARASQQRKERLVF